MVFDDPVVDDRHAPRDMGMRVRLARATMGGPARVSDAGRPREGAFLGRGFEMGELAHRAHDFDPGIAGTPRRSRSVDVNREACRVVAAVLERTQAVDQYGNAIFRADVADDSAHEAGILRGGAPPAAECTSPCSLEADACFARGVFV